MQTQSSQTPKPRFPSMAVLLSLGATGLGQIYCGRLAKGLTLFFISFAFAPIIVQAVGHSSSVWALGTFIAALLSLFGVFIYATVDAYRLARKADRSYTLKEYNRWYIYLLFILVSVAYPTNLAHTLRQEVVQAFKIPSASMVPNILPGDYILLNKMVYKEKTPQIGDIVVFPNPNARHRYYLKRIVAMPGDTVEIRNNVLWINGRPLSYEPSNPSAGTDTAQKPSATVVEEINRQVRYAVQIFDDAPVNFDRITVPNGHCFVLGDNRGESNDSRDFGPVPLVDVKGRVGFIYLPAKSWNRFGRYRDH